MEAKIKIIDDHKCTRFKITFVMIVMVNFFDGNAWGQPFDKYFVKGDQDYFKRYEEYYDNFGYDYSDDRRETEIDPRFQISWGAIADNRPFTAKGGLSDPNSKGVVNGGIGGSLIDPTYDEGRYDGTDYRSSCMQILDNNIATGIAKACAKTLTGIVKIFPLFTFLKQPRAHAHLANQSSKLLKVFQQAHLLFEKKDIQENNPKIKELVAYHKKYFKKKVSLSQLAQMLVKGNESGKLCLNNFYRDQIAYLYKFTKHPIAFPVFSGSLEEEMSKELLRHAEYGENEKEINPHYRGFMVSMDLFDVVKEKVNDERERRFNESMAHTSSMAAITREVHNGIATRIEKDPHAGHSARAVARSIRAGTFDPSGNTKWITDKYKK